MRRFFKVFAVVAVISMLLTSTALAAPPQPLSTSLANFGKGWAYHEIVDVTTDSITVTFYATRNFASCWEVRVDSAAPLQTPHPYLPVWWEDGKWAHYCAVNSSTTVVFPANSHIEVRLSFGAEADERYDWERTDVLPSSPSSGGGSSSGPEPHSDCNMVGTVPAWIPYGRSDITISWLANWCGFKLRNIEGGQWIPLRILERHYAFTDHEGNGQWTATLAPISPAQVPAGYYMLTMGTNMYKVWIGATAPGN